MMIWLLYIRFIVPVLGVFYGTSLIADEVDDKTITYLFTRPIPRGAVLLGKYLAYLACTVLLVLPSVMLVFFLIVPIGGGSIGRGVSRRCWPTSACWSLGLAAYGAVFALVGARLKRPLVVGLVFAFGWEPAVLLFPGYLKRLTVAYYLQALVPHAMPQDSAVSVLHAGLPRGAVGDRPACCALAVITVGRWRCGLPPRTVEAREYCAGTVSRRCPYKLEEDCMTTKTRYFVIGSLLILAVGLGVGARRLLRGLSDQRLARRAAARRAAVHSANAAVVAYADVHDIMTSELRQKLRSALPMKENGQQEFQNADRHQHRNRHRPRRRRPRADPASRQADAGSAIVLARGRFDQVKIEALMREHGGAGRGLQRQAPDRRRPPAQGHEVSLAFLEPGLVAARAAHGSRAAIDLHQGGNNPQRRERDRNDELMNLVRSLNPATRGRSAGSTRSPRRAHLPADVASQSASHHLVLRSSSHINGGLRGVVRAETRDDEPATTCATSSAGSWRWRSCRPGRRPERQTADAVARTRRHRQDRRAVVRCAGGSLRRDRRDGRRDTVADKGSPEDANGELGGELTGRAAERHAVRPFALSASSPDRAGSTSRLSPVKPLFTPRAAVVESEV